MLIATIVVLGLFIVNGGISVANFQKRGDGQDLFSLVMTVVGIIISVSMIVTAAAS